MRPPTKRVKQVEYWDCGFGHEHTTEEIALRCGLKQADLEAKRQKDPPWTVEKYKELLALRRGGKKFREVGEHFNIPAGYAGALFRKAERLERCGQLTAARETLVDVVDPIDDLRLSVRATNCLKTENIYCISDLIAQSKEDLLRMPNIGSKIIREVVESLAENGLSLR